MADLVKLTINGKEVEVASNATIMEAAYKLGIDIPRLCYLKDINETSACRVCVVEIQQGPRKMIKNSCTVQVAEGMVVSTDSPRVKRAVKLNLQLLAANHKFECWRCPREHNCEFLDLLRKYNIENVMGESKWFDKKETIENFSDALVIDSSKCILCGRCVSACEKLAGTGVLNFNNRGFVTFVSSALNHEIDDSGCIFCGKCIQACPVGAIREKDDLDKVEELLADEEAYTVVQMAPAVRAALGEEFGYPMGTNVEPQMYEALSLIGFKDISDVNFAADVTIMEEGTEFIGRLNKFLKGEEVALPMFTSCSPGWIRYIETYYPEYLPNLSTTKSPQQIQGALTKHYYADKIGVDKKKVKVVSVMPCIAKKTEAKLPEMEHNGLRDVDVVITTRELARLIKRKGIKFNELKGIVPQSPIAKYTGAGVIFGATGGVMEAALRTVYAVLEGKELENIDITEVRGTDNGIKEATVKIKGIDVNVAVVHGTVNVPDIMAKIASGEKQYHFIEFMACTGGCVNGGGQPVVPAKVQDSVDVRVERAKALYAIDKNAEYRASHENKYVQELYKDFLKEPNGHLSHELLHTGYAKKTIYNVEE